MFIVQKPVRRQVRLSGYGVEMALKSMEYKSQDDTNYKEKEVAEDETVETSEGHNDDRDIIHIMVYDYEFFCKICPFQTRLYFFLPGSIYQDL